MPTNSPKTISQKAPQEISETVLVIDRTDIMVKYYVAGRWTESTLFTGFSYRTGLKIDGVVGFQKGKIPIKATISKDGHQIEVTFANPFHEGEKYVYELQMLINPSEFIQSLGNLKIIEWPKENLSEIVFLKNAGKIFFSSALAQIKINPDNAERAIVPGKFARSITSHSRKSSAIRIEWGFPSLYQVLFTYTIKNTGDKPARNIHLNAYHPPTTKFQKVYPSESSQYSYQQDKDENQILDLIIDELPPGKILKIPISLQIKKKGNTGAGVLLPNFGSWQGFREITAPQSTGEAMIQSSRYWPLDHPDVIDLVKFLKKNAINASQYIKLAFEFVNQRVTYKMNGIREDAATVLQSREGDCSEMSDLFVTILRAGGIPSKIVHGWVVDLKTYELGPHAWCEFFSPKLGMRQCDPTWGYLTGVSCQHITRQREGLIKDQHTFSWSYQGETTVTIEEEVHFSLISNRKSS
ncbi:MAG: transglutaminase-like domain-containing protein [Promethearchaeota archaeon]